MRLVHRWVLAVLLPAAASAQTPAALEVERAEFARWLRTSSVSPYAAVYHQPFSGELVLGPSSPPPLDRLPEAKLDQGIFSLSLETETGDRTVPRNRDVALGDWRLRVSGERGRSVVTIFGNPTSSEPPGWYDYAESMVVDGVLQAPDDRESRRMFGLDGVEVEGTRAGTFVAIVADQPVRLAVFRLPEPGTEESELQIFFRDATNDRGTYPAGRFLTLRPLGGNRYRADFNRARNPFCAYNGIFPCPLPWSGNAIDAPIEAGERYNGSGTEAFE
jgi:hypothetical protein